MVGALGAWSLEHYEILTRAGSAVLGIMSFVYLGGCIHAKRLEIKQRKRDLNPTQKQDD